MARDLNAGNNRWTSTSIPITSGTQDFTLACRVKIDGSQAALSGILHNGSRDNNGVGIGFEAAGRNVGIIQSTVAWHGSYTLSDNIWYSVVVARRSGTAELSVDGVTAGGTANDYLTPSQGFTMGLETVSPTFDGKLAEVAVWSVGITQDEVESLARGFSPLLVRPQSLLRYWPLRGNTSPEPDLKNGFAVTLSGTSAKVEEHPRVIMPREAIYLP